MPLPKPSKMVSKRFKKPKTASPAISPPPDLDSKQPWRAQPSREWRIRVVCTDPDATDDSSADEAEPSPSSSIARKRLIHEVSLPLPSPSPPSTPRGCGGRSLNTRPTRSVSTRPSRSLCRDFESSKAEVDALLDAAAASLCPPSPRSCSSTECAVMEEEFIRFLREFLPEQEDRDVWDYDLGRWGSHQESSSAAEMLDLELDSEALSWINSLQRLP